MPDLINIAIDPQKPVFVDAKSVTAVIISPENGDITIVDRNGPPLLIEGKGGEVNADAAMKKLADHGFPLMSFSVLADGQLLYVAPSAITFIAMSPAKKDGQIEAVVGMRGVGGMNFSKPENEWQSLLDIIVKDGKNTFLKFEPEYAGRHFNYPEKLYIDLKSVKAIQADGDWARLVFENSAFIDLDSRHVRDMRLLESCDDDVRGQLLLEFHEADKHSGKELRSFIQDLVKISGTLKAIPQLAGSGLTYLRHKDITEVRFGDDDKDGVYHLGVRVKQERMDGAAFSFFWFAYASEKDRDKAAERLQSVPYNENQLFYAALYWTEALPGGEAFSDDICAKYGKPYMPMNPPKQTVDEIEFNWENPEETTKAKYTVRTGISQQECEAFFESMYDFLKDEREEKQHTSSGKDGTYLDLSRHAWARDGGPFLFCDAIEHALSKSGLDREILPPYGKVYAHDNGQIFSVVEGTPLHDRHDAPYPGRPETGYRSLPKFTSEDMKGAKPVVVEHFYRMVDLEPGKNYTTFYTATDGKLHPHSFVAKEGDILTVRTSKDYDIRKLKDEEILSGENPKIESGFQINKEVFLSGYGSATTVVEATDDPRIMRQLDTWARCMEVTEKIQLYSASSFQLAEPGDKILVQKDGYTPQVFHKEDIDNGKFSLIMTEKPSAPRAKKPKPPSPK